MKRLQISIDEDLDDALAVEAARRKTSKAALIREYVRRFLKPADADPMADLIGDIDAEPANVDEVVYGL